MHRFTAIKAEAPGSKDGKALDYPGESQAIPVYLETLIPNKAIYFAEFVIALLVVTMIARVIRRYRLSTTTQSFVEDHLSARDPTRARKKEPEPEAEAPREKAPSEIVGHYIDDFF